MRIDANRIMSFVTTRLKHLSADTVEWVAIMLLHSAILPSVIGLLTGMTDRPPPIDIVAFVWASLALLFIRSLLLRDIINTITISVGFMVHAGLLALLVFK